MKKESFLRVALPVAAVVASVGLGFAGITSAQTTTGTSGNGPIAGMMRMMHGQKPGVFGKVTAISGSTLTVESTNPKNSTTTTYSVDASSAKVLKGSAGAAPSASTLGAIAVGDTVAVRGTVTGTNVVATEVIDGVIPHGKPGGFGKGERGEGMGAMGTVTAVSGNTITITGKDGKSYTVDAGSAKIAKTIDITVGDIKVGDKIGVHGTVSGTNITAKDIMDGIPQGPFQK